MAIGEFKAKCLAVIAEVNSTGKPVLVTKRGKPLARVLPLVDQTHEERPDAIFGSLRSFLSTEGDVGNLVEPIIPMEEWDHLKDEWSPFPPK
jgi:prevent-host-death family protein